MTKFAVPTPFGFVAHRESAREYKFVVVFGINSRGFRPTGRPGVQGWSQSAAGAEKMARDCAKYCDDVRILPVGA